MAHGLLPRTMLLLHLMMYILIEMSSANFFGDEFIVDEGSLTQQPKHSGEAKSSVKKSNLDDATVKPSVRSMAMSFTPKLKQQDVAAEKAAIIERQVGSRHIEPAIDLKKSLKSLDLASKKNEVKNEKEQVKSTVGKPMLLFNNNSRNSTNLSTVQILSQKKSASPNVLTNSTITGFLSKNRKYTVDSVGKPQDVERKVGETKTEEVKAHQQDNDTRLVNSDKTVMIEKITRSNIKPANDGDNHIKVFTDSQMEKADSQVNMKRSKGGNKLNMVDINDYGVKSFKKDGGVSDERISRSEQPLKVGHSSLHVASEDDFVKLAYVKKKEMEDENAVKKGHVESSHHEAECNEDKKCPKNKYCRNFHCLESHRKHHECDEGDECADEMQCIYGRCDDKPKASPGDICDKDDDCGDGCCVMEPTIDERHGICKTKLLEFHQCSPVLFRKVWLGDKPECGPCADGLECKERGVHSSHLLCIKQK